MQALVWRGAGDIEVSDVAEPSPADDEIVVEIALAGICGSDLHAYRGAGGKRTPPLILGHEAVGRVPGDGQIYLLFPLAGCGYCELCSAGRENLCPDRRLLGLDRPGTFAARVAVPPSALMAIPAGLSPEVAALAEPCATVIQAVSSTKLSAASRVTVIGCGAIGLLAIHVVGATGATVTACDPAVERRQAAAAAGASVTLASVGELPTDTAHLVVDAVGVEETWSAGINAAMPGGAVVVVGLGQALGSVEVGRLVRSGITLRGSYAYTRDDFIRALHLLSEVPPPPTWLRRVPLSDGPDAFRDLAQGRSMSGIKVLLDPTLNPTG
jgi:threonine dehydrogenase-like Zn-dependent dehydrogenase